MKTFWITLGFSLLASVASAQNFVNPQVWAFDLAGADFAQVTGFEFGWFASATAIAPIQAANVTKPATCLPCTVSTPLPSTPLNYQTWFGAFRGWYGAVNFSDWSNRVPFDLRPPAPTNNRIVK